MFLGRSLGARLDARGVFDDEAARRTLCRNNLKQFGKGLGSVSPEGGYAWYAGI